MKRKGIKESDGYDWEKSTSDHNTSISSVPTGTTVKQTNQQKQAGLAPHFNVFNYMPFIY